MTNKGRGRGKELVLPSDYGDFLETVKVRIRTAQVRAALAVNKEMILLYWQIGKDVLERQQREGWGSKVIDHLSLDLRQTFPEVKGFSARNLKYMRAFADAYPEEEFVQRLAAQIPWFHNCTILDKIKDAKERIWYIEKTIERGWIRNVLVHQIESDLYNRQGRAITNFSTTLDKPQAELAQQILKDPYTFDFLNLGEKILERDLENALLNHLLSFLVELGIGFSFVGKQYHLEVGGKDYYIDLLFYHLKLRCFVIIDLKISEFEPEFAGKMGFYVSAVDNILRHKDDQPSIGLILCKSKNDVIVKYSLTNQSKPISVSTYQLSQSGEQLEDEVPEAMEDILPTSEQLALEINAAYIEAKKLGAPSYDAFVRDAPY